MNQRGASRLMVSGADCRRSVIFMNASSSCLRDAFLSDGSAALSASRVGVSSFEIAWRLMSMIRALTNACCTEFAFEPVVHGAGGLPPGMNPLLGKDVVPRPCETMRAGANEV